MYIEILVDSNAGRELFVVMPSLHGWSILDHYLKFAIKLNDSDDLIVIITIDGSGTHVASFTM